MSADGAFNLADVVRCRYPDASASYVTRQPANGSRISLDRSAHLLVFAARPSDVSNLPILPWSSIQAGIVEPDERRLNYRETLESPCASCPTSPCCSYLQLHTFQVRSVADLDRAVYLLNFDHIELGLSPSGEWSVYYRYPCRFLNRQDFTCRIHNRPEQPRICVHYNPYQCWYRRVLPKRVSREFLRIDRQRLEYLIARLTFNQEGNIVEQPEWAALIEGVAVLPPASDEISADPPVEDIATTRWKELAVASDSSGAVSQTFRYTDQPDACEGCAAYCCKTLVFPTEVPASRASLDFLQFALGFPGVEIGVADTAWSLIVRTTCRHLRAGRCSIYGQPERPQVCRYYDAWKCTYRVQFGLPRPAGLVRIRLEEFPWLTECFRFDAFGTAVDRLPVEAIREHIEDHWRRQTGHPPMPVLTDNSIRTQLTSSVEIAPQHGRSSTRP